MPSKSRHGKIKHSRLSKVRRERQRSLSITSRQSVISPTSTPVPHSGMVNSKVSVPAPSVTPDANDYRYVKVELLRIGILTCIILFIMIVLALVIR
jgi:hypothetical protein